MYSPLDLFQKFFTKATVRTLCDNTNRQAARNICRGKKFKWIDITMKELYKFIGLVLFTALIKTRTISDYWITNSIFSIPFPATVMNRDRYRIISWNIHMSDPDEDAVNDRKKGTPEYDRLFRLKPLMNDIRHACMSCFHPHRNLAVDERMVASKAINGLIEYIKSKPTKYGFKIFVLADSSNGYTVDYAVYMGKNVFPIGFGMSYDAVSIETQSKPKNTGHTPVPIKSVADKSKRSSAGRRRCEFCKKSGRSDKDTPWKCNECGVALCVIPDRNCFHDWHNLEGMAPELISCYSANRKTFKRYSSLFFNFVDIATTNSFLIHKDLCKGNKIQPMPHKDLMEKLTAQLCEVPLEIHTRRGKIGHTHPYQ
ncbi:unnamed protein product, partial [Coregonus sp. 'balchen']